MWFSELQSNKGKFLSYEFVFVGALMYVLLVVLPFHSNRAFSELTILCNLNKS
jgi:hypothetical protein